MKPIGIIPARYASTRFPGKPLVKIGNYTMIERVYIQASKALDYVYVATDDNRIYDEVTRFGGKAVMTGTEHKSGTDRCAEAIEIIKTQTGLDFEIIINIQGDEPFIQPEQLLKLQNCFTDNTVHIATLVKKITENKDIFDPNKPKVIFQTNNKAIYFSRSPIPYLRNEIQEQWSEKYDFYKHIGIYAYRYNTLKEITKIQQSKLELAESLEQNRWIENGYNIKIDFTDFESLAVDTPEDLAKILRTEIIE